MKKIKYFGSIPKLHVEEDYGFHALVREYLANLAASEMTEMKGKYMSTFSEFDLVLKESRKSSFTPLIKEANERVNSIWRSTRAYVKSMLSFPDAAKQAIAEEAYAKFENYGDISNMSYEEHYGNMRNLQEDLEALGNEKLALLGINLWMDQLQDAMTDYVNARMGRVQEKSGLVAGRSQQCRENMDSTYAEMVERVNALCLINGEADYASFIDSVNVLIDEQLSKLAARQTRAENKPDVVAE